MLGFILAFLGSLTDFLTSFLPASPIQAWAGSGLVGIPQVALGWLNWVVPFGDMLAVMTLWLAAIITYMTVKFFKDNVISRIIEVIPMEWS